VRTRLVLPAGTRIRDLGDLTIYADLQEGTTHDDWDVDSVAVSVISDPLQHWNRNYRIALSVMGGHGVALGTDLNGLQHQLANTSTPLDYPFALVTPRNRQQGTLDASRGVGDYHPPRQFDVRKDGLAHYGMLADFAAALRNVDDSGADSSDRLFRSAEDVLRMWEKVEAAQARASQTCEPWAGHGADQSVDLSQCYELGPNLPTWWGGGAPTLQLKQAAQLPITVRFRTCAGDASQVTFQALWEQRALAGASQACPLEVWFDGAGSATFVHY
jgi:hypothetical protein